MAYKHSVQSRTTMTLIDSINNARGLGEILLSSIDNDGSGDGYDIKILRTMNEEIDFPVVMNSGAVETKHFVQGLKHEQVDAVAASNIFYFSELSYLNIKESIYKDGYTNIRKPEIEPKYVKREPILDKEKRKALLQKAIKGQSIDARKYDGSKLSKITFCKKCLYSSASATLMQFAEDGICMGCKTYEAKSRISDEDYQERKEKLMEIIDSTLKDRDNNESNYDCIVL